MAVPCLVVTVLRVPLQLVALMFAADDRLRGLPRHVVRTMVLNEDAETVVADVLPFHPLLAVRDLALIHSVGVRRA